MLTACQRKGRQVRGSLELGDTYRGQTALCSFTDHGGKDSELWEGEDSPRRPSPRPGNLQLLPQHVDTGR